MEKTPLWEDLVIIGSIFVLWPAVLNRDNLISQMVLSIVLFLLIFILFRRWERFHRSLHHD